MRRTALDKPIQPHPPDSAGLLWALLAAGLWGTLSITGKWLLDYALTPVGIMAARATAAAIVLGVILLVVRPARLLVARRDLAYFALYGLVSVAGNYLAYFLALYYLDAILAVTLFYAYPAMATLLSWAVLKEPLDLRRALPLPVTFVGCALVAGLFGAGQVAAHPAGIAWALLGAATFALYPLFGRWGMARYSPWTVLFYSIACGALWLHLIRAGVCILSPADGALCGQLPSLEPGQLPFWAGLLYLALGPTLGAYGSYLQSVRRLEVRQASLVTTLELVITVVLAYLLLGERPSAVQWAGAALIFGAVLWVRVERRGGRSPGAGGPAK